MKWSTDYTIDELSLWDMVLRDPTMIRAGEDGPPLYRDVVSAATNPVAPRTVNTEGYALHLVDFHIIHEVIFEALACPMHVHFECSPPEENALVVRDTTSRTVGDNRSELGGNTQLKDWNI